MSTTKNVFVAAVIATLLSMVTVTGCKEGQKSTGGKSQTFTETKAKGNAQTKTNVSEKANFQTFVTYKYTDPMTGMEAFRLLIPKGWRAEGRIT